MRSTILASAAVLALAAAAPAFAQSATPVPTTPTGARPGNVIGTDSSLPTSNNASNITGADTKSPIAPRLPAPVMASATPSELLAYAKSSLRRHQTGAAQEAMERAETRLLDRSIPRGSDPLDTGAMVKQIRGARDALSRGDTAGAIGMIDTVLASIGPSAPASL